MRFSQTLALSAAAVVVVCVAGAEPQTFTLEDCKSALSSLKEKPYSSSLPSMAASTGKFPLAYSFQNSIAPVFAAKAFGAFDMCQAPSLYSWNALQTHFCTLGQDKTGICMPEACSEEVLRSQVGNKEFVGFLAMLAINVTMAMTPACAFDPLLTPHCAENLAGRDYFEQIYNDWLIFSGQGITCGAGYTPMTAGARRMIALCIILGLLIFAGTAWGFMYQRSLRKVAEESAGVGEEEEHKTLPDGSPRLPQVGVPPRERAVARPVPAFFKAFDLRDNLKEIFALNARPGEFSCFDGMRAISCGWVVIYHVILWQTRFIMNPEALLPPTGILAHWWAMPLFNFSGTLCVDTFLFMSAFLATFLLLKKMEKETRPLKRWLPHAYLSRFVRITPAYMFALFFNWKMAPLFSFGPLSKSLWANNSIKCPEQWWRHLLFINTVSPWSQSERNPQCFGHTWYLGDDMMYFMTVPWLVWLYSQEGSKKKLSIILALSVVLGCMAYNGVMAKINNWSPNTWDGNAGARYQVGSFEVPWGRAPSYFIGILTAYIWYEKKQHFPTYKVGAGVWTGIVGAVLALLLAIMYGPVTGSAGVTPCILVTEDCGSSWSTTIKVLIASCARPAWAIGVAAVSLLCFNGQGFWVNSLLSAPIMAPFSFLSYTVYLVHYTVLNFYMASLTGRIRWDFFEFVVTYLGLTMFSHCLALFVALLVEKPAIKLQKLYLDKPTAKMGGNNIGGNEKIVADGSIIKPSRVIELPNAKYLDKN
ncbi:nose resistant to fluoxetine protein 6-like [Nannochloropsis oceanica]